MMNEIRPASNQKCVKGLLISPLHCTRLSLKKRWRECVQDVDQLADAFRQLSLDNTAQKRNKTTGNEPKTS